MNEPTVCSPADVMCDLKDWCRYCGLDEMEEAAVMQNAECGLLPPAYKFREWRTARTLLANRTMNGTAAVFVAVATGVFIWMGVVRFSEFWGPY